MTLLNPRVALPDKTRRVTNGYRVQICWLVVVVDIVNYNPSVGKIFEFV